MAINSSAKNGLIAAAMIFLVGFAAGAFFWDRFEAAGQRSALVDALKNPVVVKVAGSTETKTEIAYVPKETIRYVNAAGQEITEPEKTDLDVKIAKPEFIVKINGQETAITRADNEKYLFDKNKIALDQTSKISVEVDNSKLIDALVAARVKAQQKHFSAGVDFVGDQASAGIGFSPNNTLDFKIHKELTGDKIGAGLWVRF